MTDTHRAYIVKEYYQGIKNATNEQVKKEKLITLLANLFGNHDEFCIIDQFTAGAEKAIAEIKRKDKKSERGRADTQYGSVIIEFEHNLKKTGSHAEDQLKDYLCGNWNSGIQVNFTLITTDCISWNIYTPDYDSLVGLGKLRAEEINLECVDTLTVNQAKPDEFYYFLDRYLFHSLPLPATLDEIRNIFGYGSSIFQISIQKLHSHYVDIKNDPEMQTAYAQWNKFLSITYGRFDASEKVFLTQSYLSILSKMLAYEVMTGDDFIDDAEMKEILNGDAFKRKGVDNFTAEDFFRWTAQESNYIALKPIFRSIAQGFSRFNFTNVTEDILKGVYQELVDEDTRHALGEHYTPDWLCSHIIEELDPQPGQKVLDPSCGSGSFLKAVANYLIKNNPTITALQLNDCLYGIDVHPLSVQITKATLLIAIGTRIKAEPQPIVLNVFLANTLLLPKKDITLLGNRYRLNIDNKNVEVDESIFEFRSTFYDIIFICDILAAADVPVGITRDLEQVYSTLTNRFKTTKKEFIDGVYALYKAFSQAKLNGRDSIWAYIINNSYIPFFLQDNFDIIVGNPPWLTFRDVENNEYQDELKRIAIQYNVLPKKLSGRPHLELAALFYAHCINYFLKQNGRLVFVMPRSLLSADQHDNMRSYAVKRVDTTCIWDLKGVENLFKVPSCVLFGRKGFDGTPARKEIPGIEFRGKLSNHNASIDESRVNLQEKQGNFYLSRLGNATAWSFGHKIQLGGNNAYRGLFQQGATIVPRLCYYVDIDQEHDGNLYNRLLRIRSSAAVRRDAKKPWQDVDLKGYLHSQFLFRSALANNIVPFSLNGFHLLALPILRKGNAISLAKPDTLMKITGQIESREWFSQVEATWENHKTERNKNISFIDYIDWMGKLTSQSLNNNYIVLYTASGANCVSVVVPGNTEQFPFIVEHITYMYYTNDINEANYLCAFFNSDIPNKIIKPFQAQGLMGARHIETKILEVPLPKFDESNPCHVMIAALAQEAADKSSNFILSKGCSTHGDNMIAHDLGRFRNETRAYLSKELSAIDTALARLLELSFLSG